ncbi:hypothetical protein EROM_011310 [Encephalitozoon romaleae SJ-2008]|uniref:Uncharacterized protein n=1 Tax=Encephalitozoon romaleae (strain SJ-2008) TaxID=1178016 RepID=I7AD02_ENCRO|nr:hypothetical protein EROM_011310 [Encephalitozoon romaleae SJ-2008]AFN82475.1 hypothetical protein EROM_011310 [Encephalitozoon romaleae SJ-2008]
MIFIMRMWGIFLYSYVLCSSSSEERGAIGGVDHSSSVLYRRERIKKALEKAAAFDTKILIPMIFHNDKVVVTPVSEYHSIEKSEIEYAEDVINRIPCSAWNTMVCVFPPNNSNWIMNLVEQFFVEKRGRLSGVEMYKREKTKRKPKFTDLMMKIYQDNCDLLEGFGREVVKNVCSKIKSLKEDRNMNEKEKKEEMMVLEDIRKYGESLQTRWKKDEILKAQEIVCEVFKYFWEREEDKRIITTIMYLRVLSYGGGKIKKEVFPLIHYINHSVLVKTYNRYGIRAAGMLIKQVLIKDNDCNEEYAEKIGKEVQKMESEERRMEEEKKRMESKESGCEFEVLEGLEGGSSKRKGGERRRKGRRGVRKKEKRSERRMMEEACSGREGATSSKEPCDKQGSVHFYNIHKRVLRWKKDPKKIRKN